MTGTPIRHAMKLAPAVMLLLAVSAAPARAQVQHATANLNITANIVGACSVTTVALAFGNYDPLSGLAVDNTGAVNVTCTQGVSATIGLNTGSNASGSTRRMTDGVGHYLNYELYSDTGHSTIWNAVNLVATGAAPSGSARAFTVYGRIPASQDAPVAAYSDTAVATINY